MQAVLLTLLVIVSVSMIAVVLMQRSEGGALGMGGGGMGAFMSARGAADALTRLTAILGTLFMGIALVLAMVPSGAEPGATTAEQIRQMEAGEAEGAPESRPAAPEDGPPPPPTGESAPGGVEPGGPVLPPED